jgi:hypothetical protein
MAEIRPDILTPWSDADRFRGLIFDMDVIEDSDSGVKAALAAGCDVVGITTSYSADYLGLVGARRIVNSFDELAARLGFPLSA